VIKIDVEGGELDVLRGATNCLCKTRPSVLLEWCPLNFSAYDVPCDSLLHFAQEHGYLLYALPGIVPIANPVDLQLQVIRTESFLMTPSASRFCK
jgi:Methyltransferase FkbM domain